MCTGIVCSIVKAPVGYMHVLDFSSSKLRSINTDHFNQKCAQMHRITLCRTRLLPLQHMYSLISRRYPCKEWFVNMNKKLGNLNAPIRSHPLSKSRDCFLRPMDALHHYYWHRPQPTYFTGVRAHPSSSCQMLRQHTASPCS